MTVLITVQDIEEAEQLCDRLAIMHAGRLAAFLRHALAIAQVELAKIVRDSTEPLTRAIQPALWLWCSAPCSRCRSSSRGTPSIRWPLALMPPWLRVISEYNPLTYLVNALRTLMIAGAASTTGLGVDLLVLGAVFVVLVAIAARLYDGIVR